MSKNYTKPNDDEHIDKPEDWLFGALTFARALALVLPENYGVIVDLKDDMTKLYPHAKRIIVGYMDEQIRVFDADDKKDLNEGDMVLLVDEETTKN